MELREFADDVFYVDSSAKGSRNVLSNNYVLETENGIPLKLKINDQSWDTVADYVYCQLLPPLVQKEYKNSDKKTYDTFRTLLKKGTMSVLGKALEHAYEHVVLTSDAIATKLINTGSTKLVFESGFMQSVFDNADATEKLESVLTSIRSRLISKKLEEIEKDKHAKVVPILAKIFRAFLWLKFELIHNHQEIIKYEGKSIDEIVDASTHGENSDKFTVPSDETVRKVYDRISISSKIIDDIKADPKNLELYRTYLEATLSPYVFNRLLVYVADSENAPSKTSIEEILCDPIPVEVIKVFSSDVNKLVPLVRKMYLRAARERFEEWRKQKIAHDTLEKLTPFINKKFAERSANEREKMIAFFGQKHGGDIVAQLKQSKNTEFKAMLKEIEEKPEVQPRFSISDVEKAENQTVLSAPVSQVLSEEDIIKKVLADARVAAGVSTDTMEKTPAAFTEQTTIAYSSVFSPYTPNPSGKPYRFGNLNLEFPTIAHFVVYKLVNAFPGIKDEEMVSFYNTVIVCKKKQKGVLTPSPLESSTFISVDRLMETYKQLFHTVYLANKKFNLETALAEKFFGTSEYSQKAVATFAVTGGLEFVGSNGVDEELATMTAKWLNSNRSAIMTRLERPSGSSSATTVNPRLEILELPNNTTIFQWVQRQMQDFVTAFHAYATYMNTNFFMRNKQSPQDIFSDEYSSHLAILLDTFTLFIYYKDRTEVGFTASDLSTLQMPQELNSLFDAPLHTIPDAIRHKIYRTVVSPIYFGMTVFKTSTLDLLQNISAGRKLLTETVHAGECYPCKLNSNPEDAAMFDRFVGDAKCPIAALFNMIARIKTVLVSFYHVQDVALTPEMADVACQIIYGTSFRDHAQEPPPEVDPVSLAEVQSILKKCFNKDLIIDSTSAHAVLDVGRRISNGYLSSHQTNINRTNYFLMR